MNPVNSSRAVIPLLAAANFTVGMGAFMIVGMLIPLSEAFGMTVAEAGALMILYSISYAVLSPVLVSLTGRVGRQRVLTIALAIFALANVISGLSGNQFVLFGARILMAAGAGMITPVAATVAAGISAPGKQAQALGWVLFGLSLSQVLGVPAGGYIAYTFGWRSAFFTVAALCVPVIVLIYLRVPAGLSFVPVSLRNLVRTMGNSHTMLTVSFSGFFLGSLYVTFTYLAPLLSETMGYQRDGITLVLLVGGFGSILGALAGGYVADLIGPARTLLALSIIQIVLLPFYSVLPLPIAALMLLSFSWGFFGWSFMAAQQLRLIQLDGDNASVLLALNAGTIYMGAALGSAIGALVISQFGLIWLGVASSLCMLSALVSLWLSRPSRVKVS